MVNKILEIAVSVCTGLRKLVKVVVCALLILLYFVQLCSSERSFWEMTVWVSSGCFLDC